MSKRIGFDRMIKLEWLDVIANKKASNFKLAEIKDYLHHQLQIEHSKYEARRKTITVLLRIWESIPEEHINQRKEALSLIHDLNQNERLMIHWGMCLLAYPFFRDVIKVINELFSNQKEFHVSQVDRKLIETWGQRTTMIRACRRVVQTLSEWKVISETKKKGVYVPSDKISISNKILHLWFIEAAMRAEDKEFFPIEEILNISCGFPFIINLSISDFERSERFELSQQNINRTMLRLKN